jgi:hypothetical protein
MADALELRRSHLYLGSGRWERKEHEAYLAAQEVWNALPPDQRAWLSVRGLIPYERILAIDDVGDEFFDGPQLHCRYESGTPFIGAHGYVDPVHRVYPGIYVSIDDERRIEKFAPRFKRR